MLPAIFLSPPPHPATEPDQSPARLHASGRPLPAASRRGRRFPSVAGRTSPVRAAPRHPRRGDQQPPGFPLPNPAQNPPPPPQFPPQTPLSRSRPASKQAGSSYALPAPEQAGSDPPPNNVHIGEDTAEGGRTASFHACSGAAPRRGSTGRSNQGNGDPGSAPRAEPAAALHRRRDLFRHYCATGLHGLRRPLSGLCFGNARELAGLRTRHSDTSAHPFLHSPRRLFHARAPAPLARDRCACSAGGVLGHHPVAADHPARPVPFRARPGRPPAALRPRASPSPTPSKPPASRAPPTFSM